MSGGINDPGRASAFILDEDEKPLTYTPSTKMNNCGTFALCKQDHTLGNLLRMQLLMDPTVQFVGYMMEHPLVNRLDLKVQTSSSNVAPYDVVGNAIERLQDETEVIRKEFEDARKKFKEEGGREEGEGGISHL